MATSKLGSRPVQGHELPDIARAFTQIAPRFVAKALVNPLYVHRTNKVELAACDMLSRYETVNGGVDFNGANTLYAIALTACLSV